MTVAIDADAANIAGVRFTQQAADLAAPSTGGWKLYFKSGGLYYRSTGGVVTQLAGDPTTTEGDLLYWHSGALARLAVGTNGQVLASNGTDPGWAAPTSTFAGIVTGTAFDALGIGGATAGTRIVGATTSGAPATGTYLLGDTILDITAARWWVCTTAGTPGTWTPASGSGMTTEGDLTYLHSGIPSRLAVGTSGQVLTSNGTDPGWATPPAAGMTNPMTTPADLIVGGTAGAPARLAKGADSQVLTVDPTSHLLVWATPSGGGSDMVASGASHAHGLAPDPGVTAGTTKFLREDATWAVPAGGGGATYYSAATASSSSPTDSSTPYDIAGLSVASVLAGTYLALCSIICGAKAQGFAVSITDGSGTVLWPLGSSAFEYESRNNLDSRNQIAFSAVITVASTLTIKVRAAAAGGVGSYTVYDRHLTLIKIA